MPRLTVVLLALAFAGDADALKEFKLDDKSKVLLPGTPEVSTQKLQNGAVMRLYVAKGTSGMYVVATTDIPEAANESEDKLQARLDQGRDQGVQNAKGKLAKETRIKLADKYPGREILVELPTDKDLLRNRFYLVNGRMYQLMVVGNEAFVNSPDRLKFFDSLAVGK
jgi:hypothetical protein